MPVAVAVAVAVAVKVAVAVVTVAVTMSCSLQFDSPRIRHHKHQGNPPCTCLCPGSSNMPLNLSKSCSIRHVQAFAKWLSTKRLALAVALEAVAVAGERKTCRLTTRSSSTCGAPCRTWREKGRKPERRLHRFTFCGAARAPRVDRTTAVFLYALPG